MPPTKGLRGPRRKGGIRRPGALVATCAAVYGSAWCRTRHSSGFAAPAPTWQTPPGLQPQLSQASVSEARLLATTRPVANSNRLGCQRIQARAIPARAGPVLAALQGFWRNWSVSKVFGILTLFGISSVYLGRPKADMTDGDAMQEKWSMYAKSPLRRQAALTAGLMRAGLQVARAQLARNKDKKSKLQSQAGNAIVQELLKLGPTYVKLGQIASCRSDLLAPEYIEELKRLQDAVPAFGPERAKRRLEEELGKPIDEVFESFDAKALAAASLGQVHRAKLKDGTEVAIKIQRGDLREMYDLDLAQFEKIIKQLDRFKIGVSGASQNWLEIFDEAKVLLYREIDYRAEAQNSEAVRKNFVKEGEKFNWLKIPKVFTDLTTEQILTMEFVPGTKITDNAALEELEGVNRVKLGERVGEAYLIMLCKHGFFNTDPHPGNLAVDTGVPGGRIIMYDFGQACALSDSQCDGILQCIQSIVDLDAEACVKSFDKLGVLKPDADRKAVLAKVKNNFDTGKIRSKASKGPEADKSIKADKEAAGAEKYFQFPSQLGFVFRALTQLQGVGTCLDPEWEFIESVAPKVPELQMARGKGLDYLAGEFLKQLQGRKAPSKKK